MLSQNIQFIMERFSSTITSFIHVHDLINDLTYEIDIFLII